MSGRAPRLGAPVCQMSHSNLTRGRRGERKRRRGREKKTGRRGERKRRRGREKKRGRRGERKRRRGREKKTGRRGKRRRGREKKTGRRGERKRRRGREKKRGRGRERKRGRKRDGKRGKGRDRKRGRRERKREGEEEREKKRKGEREMKREGDRESLERNNGDMMKEEETGWRGEEKIGKVWGKGVKRGEFQERMTGDSENANTREGTEGNGHCKKRKVNKFDNVDAECTVFENGQEAFDFKPTNGEWRIRQCLIFNLPGPLHLPERIPSRHACQELTNPKQVDHIVGDGSCLYHAISLEVCGTQNEHDAVRELIIDTMIRNEKSFSKYVGGDLGNYLSQHTLRPRSWGSDAEIFAAATLLQTTIVVFTPTSPDCRKWLSHPPLFSIPGVLPSDECIYLSNLCSHFELVIRV